MNERCKQEFNEKNILQDILSSLKALDLLYVYAKQECSNEGLYEVLDELSLDVSQYQRQTFETMDELGYYKLCEANKSKIEETRHTYQMMKNEL